MAVPEAVRRQEEESERALQAELDRNHATAEGRASGSEPKAEQPEPAVPSASAAAAEAIGTPASDETQGGGQVDPTTVTTAVYTKLLQQYRSLSGMFSDMNAKVRSLEERNTELEKQLADSAKPKPGGDRGSQDVPAHLRFVKPEEIADLGEPVLELQGRVARGQVEAQRADIDAMVERKLQERDERLLRRIKEDAAGGRQTESGTPQASPYWMSVEAVFPGAIETDAHDPRWAGFLDEQDPQTGVTNRELGIAAQHNGNVGAMAALLDRFGGSVGRVSLSGKMLGRVKPARATPSGANTAATEKPVLRASDYKKAVDDFVKRRITRQRFDVIESEFNAAAAEGRILNDA